MIIDVYLPGDTPRLPAPRATADRVWMSCGHSDRTVLDGVAEADVDLHLAWAVAAGTCAPCTARLREAAAGLINGILELTYVSVDHDRGLAFLLDGVTGRPAYRADAVQTSLQRRAYDVWLIEIREPDLELAPSMASKSDSPWGMEVTAADDPVAAIEMALASWSGEQLILALATGDLSGQLAIEERSRWLEALHDYVSGAFCGQPPLAAAVEDCWHRPGVEDQP